MIILGTSEYANMISRYEWLLGIKIDKKIVFFNFSLTLFPWCIDAIAENRKKKESELTSSNWQPDTTDYGIKISDRESKKKKRKSKKNEHPSHVEDKNKYDN